MKYSDIEIPSWCDEPQPNQPLGCWSLIGGYVEDHSHCVTCDCFQPIITNEKEVILNNKLLVTHLATLEKDKGKP